MADLIMKNVCKSYFNSKKKREKAAVNNFSLSVHDKEFVVLVGPSGCGKSTTLQMIAGLEEISSGEIWLDGRLINELPPKDRDIAMVFQSYALYPHMTVFENIAFALRIQKRPKAEINQRVHRVTEILGISDLLDRKPEKLSGGERQRVAIGRAIVRNPKIFLMDEPLSNLDAKLRNQMRAEIIRLHKQIKTTFIYVTHDQTEAMTLGDRIVVMKDGEIQQVGTPDEIFDNPINTFVAGFIGTPPMNLIKGTIRIDQNNTCFLELAGYTHTLSEQHQRWIQNHRLVDGSQVTVGFRPEHTAVFFEEQEDCIVTSTEISELTGSEMLIHIMIEDKEAILRQPIFSVPETMRRSIPTGTILYFRIFNQYLRLFDPFSGQSLSSDYNASKELADGEKEPL